MKFSPPIRYTNGEIDRAGKALVEHGEGSKEYLEGLEVVNNWRASHQYPMNTFVSTLHKRTSKYKKPIIAQRLKRLPTIIKKVQRYPDMRLSRMQDIGGVRAILGTVKEVRALEKLYVEDGRFAHRLREPHKDYIANPKSDGYRGIHLVYEYNNTLARNGLAGSYKGLNVELQIRTRMQHSWATAVEAMGAFMGESFKNGQGSDEWREFFALASSAFAYAEGCQPCPQHADLAPAEIFNKLRDVDNKIDALQHLESLSEAAKAIQEHVEDRKKRHLHYTIISLDLDSRRVSIWAFSKGHFDKATKALADLEKRTGGRYDQVLVSVSSIISLKEAYPNYFLDIGDFVKRIQLMIEKTNESGI